MPTRAPGAGSVERILSLKRIPILSGLSPEDLAVVAELGKERFFPKGSVLLREGEPIPALYALIDGRVHLERKGRTLGHVTSGGFVGGAAMFARDPEGLGATAETDALALELEADAAFEIFEDRFSVLHHVLREVCGWLIDLVGGLPPDLYRDLFLGVPGPRTPAADLDLVERVLFLREVPLFSQSGIDSLAELSREMVEADYPPGASLWEEGDESGTVVLVVTGTVSCATRAGALFAAGPGAPLGAVEAMAERPRWYGAVTQTRVTALQGHIEGLIDAFEDNFDMAMDYLAVIARAQIRLLEMRVSAPGNAMERLYGCEEAPDDPD
jgi:CRP/FNR family transcriptional regulator, cyclic AMP receptor protein